MVKEIVLWRRVPAPAAMLAQWPNTRVWQRSVSDGHLTAIRTVEPGVDQERWITHLSISHRTDDMLPGRYPTWDEQKEAVYRFAPGKTMASYLPPEGSELYVNVHETTFHWWETSEENVR